MTGTVVAALAIDPAQAGSLTNWQFNSTANQLELTVKDGTTPRYFLMAQPARIVVDLPNTSIGTVSTQQTYTGAIRQIRVSQFQPGLTRIVMELSPEVSLAPGQVKLEKVKGDSRWLLRPLFAQSPTATSPVIQKPAVPAKPIDASMATAPISTSTQKPAPSVQPPVEVTPARSPALPVLKNNPAASTPSLSPAPGKISDLSPKAPPPATTNSTANANATVKVPPLAAVNSPVEPTPEVKSPPLPTSDSSNTSRVSPIDPFPAIPNPLQSPGSNVTVPTLPAGGGTRTPSSSPTTPSPTRSAAAGDLDAGMKIDTTGGVAIAVPSPEGKVSPPTPVTSPAPPVSAPFKDSVSPTVETRPLKQQPSATAPSISALGAPTVTPATPRMVSAAPASPNDSTLLEIPTTIVTRSAKEPLITVPSLGAAETIPPASPSSSPAALNAPAVVPASPPFPNPGAPGASVDSSNALPSTTTGAEQPVTVSVPSLGSSQSSQSGSAVLPPSAVTPLPPDLPESPPPVVNVPITQPAIPPSSGMEPTRSNSGVTNPVPRPSAQPRVVEFGQPLSDSQKSSLGAGYDQASNLQSFRPLPPADTLLPAGTLIDLRYPGEQALNLPSNGAQQEVLVLRQEIRDSSGRVVAPEGTRVIGRFETTPSGSRFVAQAIALEGRTLPLVAESESLGGNRNLSESSLVRNAGIGVLAGGLVGGLTGGGNTGWGALGGAAAGAAATYFTAPRPATIQPGQVLQVRLQQDLRQP
ncbi:AMIN domain-containing protein [Kovacikia minuta CCNUW1]|uniref:AMIN domain-containing protein n=1 Tax=Kovacikia minuta TaxID=2931930 RepID=UPI001CCF891D|nr:AMIN domain-containing protein [Kovacikia minuta]UBF24897.1 AMIN domain-containing protein [Kovacikia minuta CCNUW1]